MGTFTVLAYNFKACEEGRLYYNVTRRAVTEPEGD